MMNKDTDKSEAQIGNGDDAVAKLMNLAGPRAEIPADLQARVHRNVRQEWARTTRFRKPLRWAIPAAMAATVVLAISLGGRAPELPPQPVGTVASVLGTSMLDGQPLAPGDVIRMGDVVATSDTSGVSINLTGELSVRIAANTSIRLDRTDALSLVDGEVYVDSGDRIYRDKRITVHAADAAVTDVGTQFSVQVRDRELRVAVREGRVDIGKDSSSYTAMAGDKLTIPPAGEAVTEQIQPYDPSWDWAASLSPGFDIADGSLLDFLKWAARETGKELVFANNDVRIAAMGTKLFGTISDFTPDEAIESVLATTRFKYRIEQGRITISE